MHCEHCNDNGYYKEGNTIIQCAFCIDSTKMLEALRVAINDCRNNGKKLFAETLEKIIQFLPEYPVIAVMEAEELGLNKDLIELIKSTFNVKSLM